VIGYAKLFYRLVGPKLLVLLLVMQVAAVIEGFGISLILPIIQGDQGSESRLASMIDWGFDIVNVNPSLTNVLIALVLFFVIRAIILVAQTWYQSRVVARNLTDMRTEFIETIARSEYDYLIQRDSGIISNVMGVELQRVNFALVQLLGLMVTATTSAVYVAIALLVAPVVTIFLAALVLPIAIIMLFLNRTTSKASLQLTDGSNRQQSFLLEALRNIKYLKATGRTKPVIDRVVFEINRVGTAYRKLTFLQGATAFGLEPLIVLVLAVVIYFFTKIRGANVLEILFLLFVFRTAAVNLVATQPAYRKFISATGSMKVYQELRESIQAHAERDSSASPSPSFGSVGTSEAGIELTDITYSYPGQDSPTVEKISLKISTNSTIAFVGPSGSGKSTTANLIASLLTPSSGEISVGGSQYSSINIDQFRSKIGYVTQESVVFNASLADNILLWQEDSDPSKLKDVISKTGLDNIRTSSDADQNLGDGGSSLSGGERQRLSIARELYWDSDLLILDEATSSVDSLLEKQIDGIINDQRGTKTIIVIAHRLSTVRNADTIYVFDGGKIVESGSFDDLVEADGLFSKMAELQSF